MKKAALVSSSLALFLGCWAGTAAAVCPTDQATLVIDQSVSMNGSGATGDPKWEIMLEKVLMDFSALPNGTHVSIVGFGNASVGGSPYKDEVVPLSAELFKGTDDAALIAAIESTAVPYANWTPLSGGTCDALEDTFLYQDPDTGNDCTLTTARRVHLYSDGLENATPDTHPCYSNTSSMGTFDDTLAGSGFGLDDNTWEWKLANMAWTGNPNLEDTPAPVPPGFRPVLNVSLLFDFTNSLAGGAGGTDGALAGADLQSLGSNAVAFFSGLSEVTYGTYFESKTVNGQPTVIPLAGDTDPAPLSSCVNAADYNRVLEAYGRDVSDNDPLFSAQDLAMRDVNDDLTIDIQDYYLVLSNYGNCA